MIPATHRFLYLETEDYCELRNKFAFYGFESSSFRQCGAIIPRIENTMGYLIKYSGKHGKGYKLVIFKRDREYSGNDICAYFTAHNSRALSELEDFIWGKMQKSTSYSFGWNTFSDY